MFIFIKSKYPFQQNPTGQRLALTLRESDQKPKMLWLAYWKLAPALVSMQSTSKEYRYYWRLELFKVSSTSEKLQKTGEQNIKADLLPATQHINSL